MFFLVARIGPDQVANAYCVGRETFFTALDYLERFLTVENSLPKSSYQLIGVTCLFSAAKMEV